MLPGGSLGFLVFKELHCIMGDHLGCWKAVLLYWPMFVAQYFKGCYNIFQRLLNVLAVEKLAFCAHYYTSCALFYW